MDCFNVYWPKPRSSISRVTIRSRSLITAMNNRSNYIQKGYKQVLIFAIIQKTYCLTLVLLHFLNELYGSIWEVFCNVSFLPVKYFHALQIEKGTHISSHTGREKKLHPLSITDNYLPKMPGLLIGRGLFLSFNLYRRVSCVICRHRSIHDSRARRKIKLWWRRRWQRAQAQSGGGTAIVLSWIFYDGLGVEIRTDKKWRLNV